MPWLAVLAVIARGGDVRLRDPLDRRGRGLRRVGDASVYGTLRRLEQAGHLGSGLAGSDSGSARKYKSVTPSGAEQLQAGTETCSRVNAAYRKLVEP